MIKEKPIFFTTDNVRAILEDRKIQTRRIIKPQPKKNIILAANSWWDDIGDENNPDTWLDAKEIKCPYEIGMHLWVKETWAAECFTVDHTQKEDCILRYKADDYHIDIKWRPSIFMPREASRITLEVTGVGAERVQDISIEDAIKEGIPKHPFTAISELEELWNSIYAKPKPKFKNKIITHYESYPWSIETSDKRIEINSKPHYCYPNAWVWINSFKRIK